MPKELLNHPKENKTPEENQPPEQIWFKEFSDKIQTLVKQLEQKGSAISFEIFFSYHETGRDKQKLQESFSRSDLFIPEMAYWTPESFRLYQKISKGLIEPERALKSFDITPETYPFYYSKLKELNIVFGSKKPILFIDVPLGHPIQESAGLIEREARQNFLEAGADFKKVLRCIKEYGQAEARLSEEREKFILGQLADKLPNSIAHDPALKDKKPVRVLMALGATHTAIYHVLKKIAPKTKRMFSTKPFNFDLSLEGERIYRFRNNQKEISDDLAARILLSGYMSDFIKNILWQHNDSSKIKENLDNNEFAKTIRKIVNTFSYQEIEEFFLGSQEDETFLEAKMESKGFPLATIVDQFKI
ncbi:MAG: hypothetical protein HY445_00395 [Candidatus Niyogibacteria bacterium]|nr:hypothetical protein [Candidatus Niyogibacteria bacterium]